MVIKQIIIPSQKLIKMKLHPRCNRTPNNPNTLFYIQRRQPHTRSIDLTEILIIQNSYKITCEIIRPRMIRAWKTPRVPISNIYQLRSTMATHIDKPANNTITTPNKNQRHPSDLHRLVITRFGNLHTKPKHKREPLKDEVHLRFPTIRIEVICHRNTKNIISKYVLSRPFVLNSIRNMFPGQINQFFTAHRNTPWKQSINFWINRFLFYIAVVNLHRSQLLIGRQSNDGNAGNLPRSGQR